MPSITVGDLSVWYLDQGSGDPVILLHGNGSSSVWWEYTLDRMRNCPYRVIAPDLRGRGDTEGPCATWTIPQLATDARDLLDKLGIGSAHFVGHSMGSSVAIQYALDHPADVKTLTLLSPNWVAGEAPPSFLDESRLRLVVTNKQAIRAVLHGVAALHPSGPVWDRLADAGLKQRDECSLGGVAALRSWKVVDRLRELAGIPTLVLRGIGDTFLCTEAVARTVTDNLPGARCEVIQGATHSPHVETPDVWATLLLEHLSRTET